MRKSYHQPNNAGEKCSTARSKALRALRFDMAYIIPDKPAVYDEIAAGAKKIVVGRQNFSPAIARAEALAYVVANAPVELCGHSIFLGGESPFFYNLMFDALAGDAYGSTWYGLLTDLEKKRCDMMMTTAPCFDGHITPGCDAILQLGTDGLRKRVAWQRERAAETDAPPETLNLYDAMLMQLDNIEAFAERLSDAAEKSEIEDIRESGRILRRVPKNPSASYREALQSYWVIHVLITLEIGGCRPGGGIGLGRPDQYFYPYYKNDMESGAMTDEEALEYTELFLLNFRHNDYYTEHQIHTPGTHGSLCGVTPAGQEAANDLSLTFMEASLRIQMPAPYLSVRISKGMSDEAMLAASDYVTGGLGFPVVNDGVLIPAFLRHGRSLYDANDYICSCCYENTIPGRESFNPNGLYFNIAAVLECFLNGGYSLLGNALLLPGAAPAGLASFGSFEELLENFLACTGRALLEATRMAGRADAHLATRRSYPMMSLFIEDCAAKGADVCAGGARYNLTGIIVSGLTNAVNSLAAIKESVYENGDATPEGLLSALRANFTGASGEGLRAKLKAAPKWGNGNENVDRLAKRITDELYRSASLAKNARGGMYQLALYSFVANIPMGERMGASADGRLAGEIITRNLNPSPGTDKNGPTAVLRSLSAIDMTKYPNGTSLDLRFDPLPYKTPEGRAKFAGFLRGMRDLGVMQIQCSFVDTATLKDARKNPEKYPDLMVKVAGYSARFVDLTDIEKEEIISRSEQVY